MKRARPSRDCNKGTFSPTHRTHLWQVAWCRFYLLPLPRQMTCEISVKMQTVFFFLAFSLYLFINWCPTLKARDLWFVYFHYCLGVYSRSPCLNVHNFKLLLYLGASSPCSPQVVGQGERVQHRSAFAFWHSKAPPVPSAPLLGVSFAGELPRNNILKAADVIRAVGCATGKGRADSHPAERTVTCQGGLTLSPQPFPLSQVWTLRTWNYRISLNI